MIVKITLPPNGNLSPILIEDEKDFKTEMSEISADVIQALRGDKKGFFEATFNGSGIVIGKRVAAQSW